jgi:hypothetical protein
VPARHRQAQACNLGDLTRLAFGNLNIETRGSAIDDEIDETNVRLRILAIGDDPAILDPRYQRLDFRMVEAHHTEPVKRHILDELAERFANPVERAVVIEMLGIDVGDDSHIGGKLQERAVALICFDDHPVALAHACIRTIGVDDTAIDHSWIEIARIEQSSDHGGRRRLAVRAADSDGLAETHQFGQHFRAADDRQ